MLRFVAKTDHFLSPHTHTHTHIAVFFEQGEWDKCLGTCEEAVEKGREVRADFKLIAR